MKEAVSKKKYWWFMLLILASKQGVDLFFCFLRGMLNFDVLISISYSAEFVLAVLTLIFTISGIRKIFGDLDNGNSQKYCFLSMILYGFFTLIFKYIKGNAFDIIGSMQTDVANQLSDVVYAENSAPVFAIFETTLGILYLAILTASSIAVQIKFSAKRAKVAQ